MGTNREKAPSAEVRGGKINWLTEDQALTFPLSTSSKCGGRGMRKRERTKLLGSKKADPCGVGIRVKP